MRPTETHFVLFAAPVFDVCLLNPNTPFSCFADTRDAKTATSPMAYFSEQLVEMLVIIHI